MRIKINPTNASAIEAELSKVNGPTTSHSFNTFDDVRLAALSANRALSRLGIAKCLMKGARFEETSGMSFPNSYKFSRTGTTITLERGTADWFLIRVTSTKLDQKGGNSLLILTPEQDAEAVAKLRKQYAVAA